VQRPHELAAGDVSIWRADRRPAGLALRMLRDDDRDDRKDTVAPLPEDLMIDLVFLTVTIAFFATAWAYANACQHL
jgi:hypothetical protein